MTEKKNKKIFNFFKSNWVITLSATLIGVFLALFLNEKVATNKLTIQKILATKNILAEISSNKKHLEKSIVKHTELLETMEFLVAYIDEDENLIAPIDSMNKFRIKYPEVVLIEDSTLLANGTCKYEGEINVDFSTPHMELNTIAWETLKNSGISTTYGFECLMFLETIDKITSEVLQKDKELLDFMTGVRDSGTKNEILIKHLKLLIDYEKSLIETYKPSEKEFKNCD